jgi:hypothetical protein
VQGSGLPDALRSLRQGVAVDATAQTGSASVGAQTNVVNLEAGALSTLYGIGLEIDLNVSNAAYATNAAPYAVNLLLTGTVASGSVYGTAGLALAYGDSANPLWNYGILGVDYSTARAFKTAFISDQLRSPTILHSDTAHTKGIHFGSATFSGNAISTPGFILDSAGISIPHKSAPTVLSFRTRMMDSL